MAYDQRNGVILPHDLDVVCLVKRNAADHTLAQDSLPKQCFKTMLEHISHSNLIFYCTEFAVEMFDHQSGPSHPL